MKNFLYLVVLIAIAACTTDRSVLKNDQTGQIARCGGNVAYAGILYPFMAAADSKCVVDYQKQGFKQIESDH